MKGDSDKIDFEFLRSNIIYYDRLKKLEADFDT